MRLVAEKHVKKRTLEKESKFSCRLLFSGCKNDAACLYDHFRAGIALTSLLCVRKQRIPYLENTSFWMANLQPVGFLRESISELQPASLKDQHIQLIMLQPSNHVFQGQ